jgi:hypothetical protein
MRYFALAASIIGLILIGAWFANSMTSDGIYGAPSGAAVYIQGSACVVNMEPQQDSISDYNRMAEDFQYCQIAHICHYGELSHAFPDPDTCIRTLNNMSNVDCTASDDPSCY